MPDGRDDGRITPPGRLKSFGWAQLGLTLLPGGVCASPLICAELAKSVPAFGYAALVMLIPSLITAVYFVPAYCLVCLFTDYRPDTLKGGGLLPLPAYSATDWAMLLSAHAAIVAVAWLAWQGVLRQLGVKRRV